MMISNKVAESAIQNVFDWLFDEALIEEMGLGKAFWSDMLKQALEEKKVPSEIAELLYDLNAEENVRAEAAYHVWRG